MALSELQKNWLTKDVLYNHLRNISNQMNAQFNGFQDKLEWLNLISSEDMDDIAVPAETKIKLSEFRTALNGLMTEYNTNVATLVDNIRTL